MSNLTFTPSAIEKIKEIISEESNPDTALRVFVQGGGCSGFKYGFSLDEEQNEDDYPYNFDGVKVVVDSASMMYIHEAVVDFTEDLNGAQFKITNPNAASTCGCGSSFSVG
jgi:iron-sulfur cluster insertion protein